MSKAEFDPAAKRNLIIIGGVLGLAILVSSYLLLSKKEDPNKPTSSLPTEIAQQSADTQFASKPAGYDDLAIKAETAKVQDAKDKGVSHLPSLDIPTAHQETPQSQRSGPAQAQPDLMATQPLQNRERDIANGAISPDEAARRAQAAEAQRQREESAKNAILQQKIKAYTDLVNGWGHPQSEMGTEYVIKSRAPDVAQQYSEPVGAPQSAPVAPAPPVVPTYRAGESFYVSIDTSVNTDEPSTVFATILTGPLKAATLFGQARKNPNDTITIEFDKISIKGRPQMSMRGVVLDPDTGRAALTGKVNRRIMARYILPGAASVANTYGTLLAKQGQTTSLVAGGGVAVANTLTNTQLRDAATASGLATLSTAIAQNAAASGTVVELPGNISAEVKLLQDLVIQ